MIIEFAIATTDDDGDESVTTSSTVVIGHNDEELKQITIGAILAQAEMAVGATFHGYVPMAQVATPDAIEGIPGAVDNTVPADSNTTGFPPELQDQIAHLTSQDDQAVAPGSVPVVESVEIAEGLLAFRGKYLEVLNIALTDLVEPGSGTTIYYQNLDLKLPANYSYGGTDAFSDSDLVVVGSKNPRIGSGIIVDNGKAVNFIVDLYSADSLRFSFYIRTLDLATGKIISKSSPFNDFVHPIIINDANGKLITPSAAELKNIGIEIMNKLKNINSIIGSGDSSFIDNADAIGKSMQFVADDFTGMNYSFEDELVIEPVADNMVDWAQVAQDEAGHAILVEVQANHVPEEIDIFADVHEDEMHEMIEDEDDPFDDDELSEGDFAETKITDHDADQPAVAEYPSETKQAF
jgi:hypothetical protein